MNGVITMFAYGKQITIPGTVGDIAYTAENIESSPDPADTNLFTVLIDNTNGTPLTIYLEQSHSITDQKTITIQVAANEIIALVNLSAVQLQFLQGVTLSGTPIVPNNFLVYEYPNVQTTLVPS